MMEHITLIQSKIYEIQGQKVMLDRDLAQMYGVETRVLNQAVKRNIDRFPVDFMFQLTDDDWQNLKSQSVISSWGGSRRVPFAFTEQGVAMLSSVLTSKLAIQVNIAIMRTFVTIRHSLPSAAVSETAQLHSEIKELKAYIEEAFADYNDVNDDTRMQLELINETLAELGSKSDSRQTSQTPIGYKMPKNR